MSRAVLNEKKIPSPRDRPGYEWVSEGKLHSLETHSEGLNWQAVTRRITPPKACHLMQPLNICVINKGAVVLPTRRDHMY